jgi:hypothetical protein
LSIVYFKLSHLTGVFESLKDEKYFNQIYLDHGVVTWPGKLDLAPDATHAGIKKWSMDFRLNVEINYAFVSEIFIFLIPLCQEHKQKNNQVTK